MNIYFKSDTVGNCQQPALNGSSIKRQKNEEECSHAMSQSDITMLATMRRWNKWKRLH